MPTPRHPFDIRNIALALSLWGLATEGCTPSASVSVKGPSSSLGTKTTTTDLTFGGHDETAPAAPDDLPAYIPRVGPK